MNSVSFIAAYVTSIVWLHGPALLHILHGVFKNLCSQIILPEAAYFFEIGKEPEQESFSDSNSLIWIRPTKQEASDSALVLMHVFKVPGMIINAIHLRLLILSQLISIEHTYCALNASHIFCGH